MGADDTNEGPGDGECVEHLWEPGDVVPVTRDGAAGFATTLQCALCPAVVYEPSNLDRFPDTGGLGPWHRS